ncbi:activin receptor type-1-like [Trichogramma pretiosum]|uniref:activin receptor type-1-like n=1 Tax=Trichogramma pretiosum TaxID=7493 RepID=UPI0006C9CA33|nr:activin receptor type-1-like [Trichogramma pretiosum]
MSPPRKMQPKMKCYVCENDECDKPKVCENAILCFKSAVREHDGTTRISRGCVLQREHVPLYCNKHLASGASNDNIQIGAGSFHTICCQEEFCNSGPFPELRGPPPSDLNKIGLHARLVLYMLPLFVFFTIIFATLYLVRKKKRDVSTLPRRDKKLVETGCEQQMLVFATGASPNGHAQGANSTNEIRATAAGDSTLKEYLEGQSLTSGSGSGLPLLVQRTLSKQVALVECLSASGNSIIGSGSFGREIWRGVWHGENVAVKIFCSRDEAKWARETEVYSQLLPSRHDNILGYIGSDMTSRASCTQLWVVTHYHSSGSLYHHLLHLVKAMNHEQMFNICLSIANGLLYLHTEIHGTQGKPAMAHRNLKSKNIIVKNNGACAIADLSCCATQDKLTERFDTRLSSRRYMSPELLDQTYDHECLEGFRRADIYSLGLIFWEVCTRCSSNGVASDYSAPFAEWLTNDKQEPTYEEMVKLVVTDQRRPHIPNRWHTDPSLSGMAHMISECWHQKAAARLPILRIKKTLVKLATSDPDVDLPID